MSAEGKFSSLMFFSPYYFTDFIESLPLANTPEVFGLHPNAEIGYYTQAARDMWLHLVELQPQTGKLLLYLCIELTSQEIIDFKTNSMIAKTYLFFLLY